jgi:hypothetical protein
MGRESVLPSVPSPNRNKLPSCITSGRGMKSICLMMRSIVRYGRRTDEKLKPFSLGGITFPSVKLSKSDNLTAFNYAIRDRRKNSGLNNHSISVCDIPSSLPRTNAYNVALGSSALFGILLGVTPGCGLFFWGGI